MSKIKEEEFYLWSSIVPDLQKNKNQCLKEAKDKSIRTYPPDDFQLKRNKIRDIFEQGQFFDEEQFLDVFAFMIEEKVNLSLLELSDQFVENFGRQNQYWTSKITHWANLMTFTNKLTIWTVTQFMRNFVNYVSSPIQRDIIYQWRTKTQAYISSLQFLLKKIKKIKKTDGPFVLDDAYSKYHKQKVLYMTFLSKFGLGSFGDSQNSYNEEVTMTFQNKSKAQKKLFNFPCATRILDDGDSFGLKNSRMNHKKSVNTLEKYFGKKRNSKAYTAEQVEISNNEQLKIIQHQKFVSILQKIGKVEVERLDNLRIRFGQQGQKQRQEKRIRQENEISEQLMKTSKKAFGNNTQPLEGDTIDLKSTVFELEDLQSEKYAQYPLSHFAFIHNPADFYWHVGFPVGQRDFIISNPFKMYHWVNYWINDEQEYEEMMAESLSNDRYLRSDNGSDPERGEDTNDSRNLSEDEEENGELEDDNFIDRRKVVTEDYVDYNNLAPQDRMEFVQQVQEGNSKWVTDYRHSVDVNGQSSQIDRFAGFIILPIYEPQLPYPIEGTDDPRTKRRQISSKFTKSSKNSDFRPNRYQIEEIIENSDEDNSTTNFHTNSRPPKIQIIQPIYQVDKEENKYENNFQTTVEQTTFEQAKDNQNEQKDIEI